MSEAGTMTAEEKRAMDTRLAQAIASPRLREWAPVLRAGGLGDMADVYEAVADAREVGAA